MKKHIVSFIVLSILFTEIGNSQILFGVKGGVNLATLTEQVSLSPDSRTAFHLGAMVEVIVTDKFSIQPELLVSSQGAKEVIAFSSELIGGDISVEEQLKLTYLNVPIMAKLYLINGLNIQIGPQFGFLIDSEIEVENGASSVENDADEFFENFDFGGSFGAGYKFNSGLNISARYNLGLTNVFDSGSNDFSSENSVYQLSIGYFF